jgi:hypothetical protein
METVKIKIVGPGSNSTQTQPLSSITSQYIRDKIGQSGRITFHVPCDRSGYILSTLLLHDYISLKHVNLTVSNTLIKYKFIKEMQRYVKKWMKHCNMNGIEHMEKVYKEAYGKPLGTLSRSNKDWWLKIREKMEKNIIPIDYAVANADDKLMHMLTAPAEDKIQDVNALMVYEWLNKQPDTTYKYLVSNIKRLTPVCGAWFVNFVDGLDIVPEVFGLSVIHQTGTLHNVKNKIRDSLDDTTSLTGILYNESPGNSIELNFRENQGYIDVKPCANREQVIELYPEATLAITLQMSICNRTIVDIDRVFPLHNTMTSIPIDMDVINTMMNDPNIGDMSIIDMTYVLKIKYDDQD